MRKNLLFLNPVAAFGIALNKLRLAQARRLMPQRVSARPGYVQLETTNICNLQCRMCPVKELGKVRKPRHMSAEDVRQVLSQIPTTRHVALQGIGEPLLNPHISEIIRLVTRKGLKVHFNTNGTRLSGKVAQKLLGSGLSRLHVSVDGSVPETFEAIRRGAKFDQVVENVRQFVDLRKSMGQAYPKVNIMTVAMQQNLDELAEIVFLAKNMGADSMVIKGLRTGTGPSWEVPRHVIQEMRALAAELWKKDGFEVGISFEPAAKGIMRCRWPWTQAYITAEGDVTPCCNIPDVRTVSFGNIYEETFDDIWNNDLYQQFRKKLRAGNASCCEGCPDY